jgi:hypothetical protein
VAEVEDVGICRVERTASFQERLDAIEAFLTEADAGFAFDDPRTAGLT